MMQPAGTNRSRAVFLDRDGTLNVDVGYLGHVDRLALFPWSIDAVRLLNRAGLRVVVVTNQAGVARGFFPEAVVEEIHREITSRFAEGGARIDAYYYCPHHPDGKVALYKVHCDCRKPGPGLIDRAARDLGIDPARSYVVGDRWLDIQLARAVGAQAILVRTGYGATEEPLPPPGVSADSVQDNLIGAVSWILSDARQPS